MTMRLGAWQIDSINNVDLFALCDGLPDASVDMVLADLPYGTTACAWDTVIPFEPMWSRFKRVIKPRGAIVLTATEPFASTLIASNLTMFKYDWCWIKSNATDFVRAKLKPMGQHEHVLVFSQASVAGGADGNMNYFPQDLVRINAVRRNGKTTGGQTLRGSIETSGGKGKLRTAGAEYVQEYENYPTTTLYFAAQIDPVHPTQKPVALFEYLIRTYTREGELVLDPTCGSGTTALAARNAKRHWICGDTDAHYCDVARDRLRLPFEARRVKASDDVSDLPLFAPASDGADAAQA